MDIKKTTSGFTLVELTVVILIVGLLLVGILQGQSIITATRITSTITEIEQIEAAVENFRDSYGLYPGDMANATTRLRDCDNDACNNGDGDGLVDVDIGAENELDEEGVFFFNHMRVADYLTSFSGDEILAFGDALPAAAIGGGYMVGHYDDTGITPVEFEGTELRFTPYLLLTGTIEDVNADSGILTPDLAARIDLNYDDGLPATGKIISQDTADACRDNAAPQQYDVLQTDQNCVIAITLPKYRN